MQDEPQVAHFDCFSFDLESGCLMMRNFKIRLREQQAKLLAHMISKAGRLTKREEIHLLLWPTGAPNDSEQAINKLVSQLRAALGDNKNGSKFIETIPLRGYRFVVPVTLCSSSEWNALPGHVPTPPRLLGDSPTSAKLGEQIRNVRAYTRVSDTPRRRATDVFRRRSSDAMRRRASDLEGTEDTS